MEEEFVTYEIALRLKELEFDEECLASYHNTKIIGYEKESWLVLNEDSDQFLESTFICKAPLWQQAFRFFREKYGLHYIICKNIQMDGYGYREVILIPYMEENKNTIFKTYEEAELACIRKLIEIAKEQNVK